MTKLEECRAEIDRVDQEICALYERRMRAVEDIARYKKEHDLPVLQPGREEAVLQKAQAAVSDPALRPGARRVFETLMEVSRTLQATSRDGGQEGCLQGDSDTSATECSEVEPNDITAAAKKPCCASRSRCGEGSPSVCTAPPAGESLPIGFQGEEGSFSEAALEQAFGTGAPRRNYPRFADVFEALRRGEIRCGVLPIENSSTGGVSEVYDLLHQYDFYITGEEYVAVRQHLLGLPGATLDEIREVRSHPQGLEQSRAFLERYPSMRPVPWLNTAAAALSVAQQKDASIAAVARRRAASLYGLEILAPDVNDLEDNTTRFVLIERSQRIAPLDDKVSVVFSLDDRAGTLYKLLGYFFEQSVNLLKIESRPLRNSRWKYFLYVDLQGSVQSAPVERALRGIAEHADYYRLLGSYRAGRTDQ